MWSARRIRAPQDKSGPVGRIRFPQDKAGDTERIRVPQYDSGPRTSNQGPHDESGPRWTDQWPRETDEGRQDELRPCWTNHGLGGLIWNQGAAGRIRSSHDESGLRRMDKSGPSWRTRAPQDESGSMWRTAPPPPGRCRDPHAAHFLVSEFGPFKKIVNQIRGGFSFGVPYLGMGRSTRLAPPKRKLCDRPCLFRTGADPVLKEITHLSHFFENLVNNFHNAVFHSLFRNTYYFPN